MARVWNRLTLLQRFTLASATIAVALAVVLSNAIVRAIESFATRDEGQVAADLVLRTIAPQLRPADFKGTLPPERRALLDELFLAHGVSYRALRIRLWRADGALLYSNVPEPKALLPAGVDLSTQNGYAVFVERQGRLERITPSVLRFFVPVQAAGNPKPIAAFEIFYDLTHLHQQLQPVRRIVWIAVLLGFFFLYTSVDVLVRRASRRLLKQQDDLKAAHLGTYEALASAIDAKDSYTGDHSAHMADLAAWVGRLLRLPPDVVEDVRVGARLHDLGKIGVPDAILNKPGPLNPDELVIMRRHAERGFEILQKAPVSEAAKLAVRHSHERWDGKGYPAGLAGEAIPLVARIVTVVDAYEAMTSDRPYRKALPVQEALARLERDAGSHFDPHIARTFVQLIRKEKALPGPAAAPAPAAKSATGTG